MAKDTFYLSHDYNSRNDSKIKKLLSKHGYTGYGIFWAIVEDLYNNANALPTDYDSIAFDLRTTPEIVKSIINEFNLFVIDADKFGSLSVERRLNERNEKSVKARESALNRWNKIKDDANALRTQSECNAIKDSIVKESKEKDSSSNFAETSSATKESVGADSLEKEKAFTDSVKAKPKKEKPNPKPPSPFSDCMTVYYDFMNDLMGVPPKIDGQEGKALNSIIKYLTTITTDKEPEGIVNAFKYILVNKSKWDPFHQNQLKISQINSNLTNIINSIKNGTAKKSVTANNYDNNKYRTANTESAM